MASQRLFAVVGAGLCGTRAAEVLRQEGFDGRILLCGDEPDRPYDRPPLPHFGSDPYDWKLQHLGRADRWERVVARGDLEGDSWALFDLDGDRAAAALMVNRPREIMAIRRRMAARPVATAGQLADLSTDLRELAKGSPWRPRTGGPSRRAAWTSQLLGWLRAAPRPLPAPPASASRPRGPRRRSPHPRSSRYRQGPLRQ